MQANLETPRILELDGVRGLAILAVLLANGLGVPLLWAGVDLFFVLSGFLITGILIRQREAGHTGLGHFYRRRALRILPPYLLLLCITTVAFGTGWLQHWYWFAFFATNIGAALHQLSYPNLLPLWSLAVEEQFYLVWPLVVLHVRRQALFAVAVALLLTAPLLRALATPWFDTFFPIYYLTPFRMDLLASGALLAALHHWQRPRIAALGFRPQFAFVAVAAILVSLTVLDPGFRTSANSVRGNVLIFACTNLLATALVTIALVGQGFICRLLRLPALRYLGKISYSMYLIHQTAILLAAQLFPGRLPKFALAVVFTILYGTLCWYAFERRLLARRS